MELENRYIVFKRKDAVNLDPTQRDTLARLVTTIDNIRWKQNGKKPLRCLVIEDHWPEYGPALAMLAARVNGIGPQLEASHTEQQVGGDHYKSMRMDVAEFCFINGIPFNEGSVIKYIARWRTKNGIEDLRKARHFIDILISLEEAGKRP